MKRTPWTEEERDSLIAWHEGVIAQYPEEIQKELRRARQRFLQGVRITLTVNDDNGRR